MLWRAGLSVGVSFAEFSAFCLSEGEASFISRVSSVSSVSPAKNDPPTFGRRWYLPKQSLAEGLRLCLQSLKSASAEDEPVEVEIYVTSQTAEWVLARRCGGPIAWLCTSGFENAPGLPLDGDDRPLVSSEMRLGVAERTDASGQVELEPSSSELEFLAAKLHLLRPAAVALGFLHSPKNPHNEELVGRWLKERGFLVCLSSRYAQPFCEAARWWLTQADAYVASELAEFCRNLPRSLQGFELAGLRARLHFGLGESLTFSQLANRRNLRCLRPSSEYVVLHLGLENFVIAGDGEQLLSLQASQIVGRQISGELGLTEQSAGFEPGPMVMGRALTPTLIDLVLMTRASSEMDQFGQHLIFKELLIDGIEFKLTPRLQESLAAMTRPLREGGRVSLNTMASVPAIIDLALLNLIAEIQIFSVCKSILVTGALAPLLFKDLQRLAPDRHWQRGPNFAEAIANSQILGQSHWSEGLGPDPSVPASGAR